VPPPPVCGAAVGIGLVDERDDGDGDGDGEVRWLGFALGVTALVVRLGRIVTVVETVLPGENVVGVAEGEDPEQAVTDAEASIARVAQPTAATLEPSLLPVMGERISMGPPP
jgi:hypothetical protein